jgi:hypothetical protein
MDMESLVWAAYLELLESQGRRMTRRERRELAEHRQRCLEAALRAAATDAGAGVSWEQLGLFGDD